MTRRLFQLPGRSPRTIRSDVDAEFAFHLEARTEELLALGHPLAEAKALALRDFGDLQDARTYINRLDRRTETARRRKNFVGDLRQDLVYAVRKLRTSPGFALTAILTLALGVGANTAIFSVVNGVLFRALPFPRSEQLYQVWSSSPSAGIPEASVSPVDLDDWRVQRRVLADIGGYWYGSGSSGVDLTGLGDPQRLAAVFVTPGFFGTLGVLPSLGRLPREDELVRGGRDRVVMLSHAFWQRQFAGDPGVVGSSVTLGGAPYEVLGVLPRTFTYPAEEVDVFVPYSTIPDAAIPRIRPVRILDVVARANEGITVEQVRTEMNTITARLAQQYPEDDGVWGAAAVKPLRDAMTGNVRVGLLVLLGAVAFVLLIACVNVASLLLARASTRGREIAVRVALGASRGRVVRQLLTESMVLATAAGIAGLAVAYGGMRLMLSLGAGQLPRGIEVRMDAAVLAYALVVSLATGLLFGLAPALRASAADLQGALCAGGRGLASAVGNRLRSGLVVSEVALAMMLVIGGGLMARSFLALVRVDPGFRPDHVVVLNYTISADRHTNYAVIYQQMLERVRAVPGVVAAGAMKDAPMRGNGERNGFRLPGMVVPAGQAPPTVSFLHVSEGVFHALGARITDGREFAPTDRADAPRVVVINEAFARRWFPGERAVGKSLIFGENTPVGIVGVVKDIRQRSMAEPAEPAVYVHNLQNPRVRVNLVVRTAGEPLASVGAIRSAIWSVDRDQPITSIFTFDDVLHEALARPRLLTGLLGFFGALGLALGALGLYGVLAYLVTQRQREIGVRLALGARPGDVLRMIVRHGLTLTAAGVAIGAVGALALGRFLTGILYGVRPTDPVTMAAVMTVLLAAATLASWIPARRAAGVDPAVTLREE